MREPSRESIKGVSPRHLPRPLNEEEGGVHQAHLLEGAWKTGMCQMQILC